jgi:hypothetical protein
MQHTGSTPVRLARTCTHTLRLPLLQHNLVPGGRSGTVSFRDQAVSFDAQLAERWQAAEAKAAAANSSSSCLPTSSGTLPAVSKLSSASKAQKPKPRLRSVRGSPSSSFTDHEVYAIASRLSTFRKFSGLYKTRLGPLVAETVDDIFKSLLLDRLCHWAARHPEAVGAQVYPAKCQHATRLLSDTVRGQPGALWQLLDCLLCCCWCPSAADE